MNREILFRGKRLNNGEWVYGGIRIVQNRYYIIPEDSNPFGFEVDPDTVGQYTGVTDMNGIKIFEGDIIRSYGSMGDEIIHCIRWSDKEGYFEVMNIYGCNCGCINQAWVDEFGKEIIGNIHDNPDLLKGGTK